MANEVTSLDRVRSADPSKSVLVIGAAPTEKMVWSRFGATKKKTTRVGVFDRDPAHKAFGHEDGEVFITNERPARCALTPLVFEKLVSGDLRFATAEDVEKEEAIKAELAERVRRNEEAVKKQALANYVFFTGGSAGFEEAWPDIRRRQAAAQVI